MGREGAEDWGRMVRLGQGRLGQEGAVVGTRGLSWGDWGTRVQRWAQARRLRHDGAGKWDTRDDRLVGQRMKGRGDERLREKERMRRREVERGRGGREDERKGEDEETGG